MANGQRQFLVPDKKYDDRHFLTVMACTVECFLVTDNKQTNSRNVLTVVSTNTELTE